MTTREPGASEVLMPARTVRPRPTAARASRPAAIITSGFEVFVHEVIAAISTSPWPRSAGSASSRFSAGAPPPASGTRTSICSVVSP